MQYVLLHQKKRNAVVTIIYQLQTSRVCKYTESMGFFFPFFFLFDVDQELSEMLKCITVTDQSHGSLLFNSQILVRSVSVHLTLKAWRPVTVICLTHSSRRSFCIWIAVWIKALSKDCLVSGSGDTAAWWWEGRDSGIWWWKRYSDGWAAW